MASGAVVGLERALRRRDDDPVGAFVRRRVPGIEAVPLARLAEPWCLPSDPQRSVGFAIGCDDPQPNVDDRAAVGHAMGRLHALRATRTGAGAQPGPCDDVPS